MRSHFSLLFFFLVVAPVHAQWQSVSAYGLLGYGPARNQGAMAYSDGVAWAGVRGAYKSTDAGLTWTSALSSALGPGVVSWIFFRDRDNGMVCGDQGMVMTRDGGKTWNRYFTGKAIFCAAFVDPGDDIVVGNTTDRRIEISSNGGSTWQSVTLPNQAFLKDLRVFEAGHVIGFAEIQNSSGPQWSEIVETTDYGSTWSVYSGRIDADCHSFEVANCDHKIILGINEEGGNYSNNDRTGEILRSTDGGNSFVTIKTYGFAALRGCVLQTPGVIYTAYSPSAMLESTDLGLTWTSTSGPTLPIDCHALIAIDDSILLTFNDAGTIYRKIDPRAAVSTSSDPVLSASSVAFSERLAPCSPSVSRVIHITTLCGNGTVASTAITGPGASGFTASATADSIVVDFAPGMPGSYSATLTVTFTNGHTIDIPLSANVEQPVSISIETADVTANAIGEIIQIPIVISSEGRLDHASFDLRFDTTDLSYRGTYLELTPSVDRTVWKIPGLVHIDLGTLSLPPTDELRAYAAFRYFPSMPNTLVVIDSPNFTASGAIACSATPGDTSIVSSIPFCGQQILSHFVKYQEVLPLIEFVQESKTLVIEPNLELSGCLVEISNTLGTPVFEGSYYLSAGRTVRIGLQQLPSGTYFGRLSTPLGIRLFRFEVLR